MPTHSGSAGACSARAGRAAHRGGQHVRDRGGAPQARPCCPPPSAAPGAGPPGPADYVSAREPDAAAKRRRVRTPCRIDPPTHPCFAPASPSGTPGRSPCPMRRHGPPLSRNMRRMFRASPQTVTSHGTPRARPRDTSDRSSLRSDRRAPSRPPSPCVTGSPAAAGAPVPPAHKITTRRFASKTAPDGAPIHRKEPPPSPTHPPKTQDLRSLSRSGPIPVAGSP